MEKNKWKKSVILNAIIVLLLNTLVSYTVFAGNAVKFFVVTDPHTGVPSNLDADWVDHGMENIDALGVDFLVNCGDLAFDIDPDQVVNNYVVTNKFPSWAVPGDHDASSIVPNVYDNMKKYMDEMCLPWDYYILKDNVLFIFLGSFAGPTGNNSQALGGTSFIEKQWLTHLFNKFNNNTTVIFNHVGVYETTKLTYLSVRAARDMGHKSSWMMDLEWWDNAFTNNPQLMMMIHGHDHAEAYDDGSACSPNSVGAGSLVEKTFGINTSIHIDVEEIGTRNLTWDDGCDPWGGVPSPVEDPLVYISSGGINVKFWNFTSQAFDDILEYNMNFTTSFDSTVPMEIGIPDFLIDNRTKLFKNHIISRERYIEYIGLQDTNLMPDPGMDEIYWWEWNTKDCTGWQTFRCWLILNGIDNNNIRKHDSGRQWTIGAGDVGGTFRHAWEYTKRQFPIATNRDYEAKINVEADADVNNAVRIGIGWINASELDTGTVTWSNYSNLSANVLTEVSVTGVTAPADAVYGYPIVEFNAQAVYLTHDWTFSIVGGGTTTVNPSLSVNSTSYMYTGSLQDFEWARVNCPVASPEETHDMTVGGNQLALYQMVYVDPEFYVYNTPVKESSGTVEMNAQTSAYTDKCIITWLPDKPPSGQYDFNTSNIDIPGAEITFFLPGRHPANVYTTIYSNANKRSLITVDPSGGTDIMKFFPEITVEPTVDSVVANVSDNTISISCAGTTPEGLAVKSVDRTLDIYDGAETLMVIIPSTDTIDIAISSFTVTYKRWEESSDFGAMTVSHTIGGFSPAREIEIRKNGTPVETIFSDGSGYIDFNYSGELSTVVFEAEDVSEGFSNDGGGVWQYRKEITVNSSSAQTDFQVFITGAELNTSTLITESKLQSDLSDARFATGESAASECSYWVDSAGGGFWVKFPDLVSGDNTVYFYYGNDLAASSSDGQSVFEFFDDFETWNGWSDIGSGSAEQSSEQAYGGTYSLKRTLNANPSGTGKPIGSVLTLNDGYILEGWLYRTTGWPRIEFEDTTGNGYGISFNYTTNNIGIERWDADSQVAIGTDGSVILPDTSWFRFRFIATSGNNIEAQYLGTGDTVLASATATDATHLTFSKIGMRGGQPNYFDNLLLRKHSLPEPSVAGVGNEEEVETQTNPPYAPINPLCEGQSNPVNVADHTPDFSWTFSDPDGDNQAAYRLIVADDMISLNNNIGDMWDTGKYVSSSSASVYDGSALLESTQYYWKVVVWDVKNASSSYCAAQNFTMGNNTAPNSPSAPLCEGQTNPVNIDDYSPEFAWTFTDIDEDDEQTAYQVLVASSSSNLSNNTGDMWDSGKVISVGSTNISYNGSALEGSSNYYWKVRTWDLDDIAGDYCSEQTFSTAASGYESIYNIPMKDSLRLTGQVMPGHPGYFQNMSSGTIRTRGGVHKHHCCLFFPQYRLTDVTSQQVSIRCDGALITESDGWFLIALGAESAFEMGPPGTGTGTGCDGFLGLSLEPDGAFSMKDHRENDITVGSTANFTLDAGQSEFSFQVDLVPVGGGNVRVDVTVSGRYTGSWSSPDIDGSRLDNYFGIGAHLTSEWEMWDFKIDPGNNTRIEEPRLERTVRHVKYGLERQQDDTVAPIIMVGLDDVNGSPLIIKTKPYGTPDVNYTNEQTLLDVTSGEDGSAVFDEQGDKRLQGFASFNHKVTGVDCKVQNINVGVFRDSVKLVEFDIVDKWPGPGDSGKIIWMGAFENAAPSRMTDGTHGLPNTVSGWKGQDYLFTDTWNPKFIPGQGRTFGLSDILDHNAFAAIVGDDVSYPEGRVPCRTCQDTEWELFIRWGLSDELMELTKCTPCYWKAGDHDRQVDDGPSERGIYHGTGRIDSPWPQMFNEGVERLYSASNGNTLDDNDGTFYVEVGELALDYSVDSRYNLYDPPGSHTMDPLYTSVGSWVIDNFDPMLRNSTHRFFFTHHDFSIANLWNNQEQTLYWYRYEQQRESWWLCDNQGVRITGDRHSTAVTHYTDLSGMTNVAASNFADFDNIYMPEVFFGTVWQGHQRFLSGSPTDDGAVWVKDYELTPGLPLAPIGGDDYYQHLAYTTTDLNPATGLIKIEFWQCYIDITDPSQPLYSKDLYRQNLGYQGTADNLPAVSVEDDGSSSV